MMLRRAKFVALAQTEFDAAVDYHQLEANRGAALAQEVRRIVGLAMEFPESVTLVPVRRIKRQVRLYRLNPDFPYDVVATAIEEDGLLLVVALAHQKRRPRYWVSRLADGER